MKDINSRLDEEIHNREEQHNLATKAEKRANDLTLEVEELRSNHEQVLIINTIHEYLNRWMECIGVMIAFLFRLHVN